MSRKCIYPNGKDVSMNEFERISCHHFAEINGYAYFSNWFYNGLFQVELKTARTVFLGYFEKEIKDELNVHWELFRQNNLICFLPRRGRHVHVYSLEDCSISAIEIRKISEKFFRPGEVIVDGEDLIFIPMEKSAPIRKLNLHSWLVTNEVNTQATFKGDYLSQNWNLFPEPQLLEKYKIKRSDKISWQQMPDGKWCAFLPLGRHLLWYTPEEHKIESVPLIIVNEEELDSYLRPMRQKYLNHGHVVENESLTLSIYRKTITRFEDSNDNANKNRKSIGQNIWHFIKA